MTAEVCACGKELVTANADHTYANEYTIDGEYHWHKCTVAGCNGKKEAHTATNADDSCLTAEVCACGKELVAANANHTYSEYTVEGENHWQECQVEGCTGKTAATAHTAANPDTDCTTDDICVCGTIVTRKNESHALVDKYNETHHWQECENGGCNYKTAEEAHAPVVDGKCHTDDKCACGYVATAATTHTDENEDCVCDVESCQEQLEHQNNGDCICDVCGTGSHIPGADDGDCTTAVKCANCDAIAIPAKEHVAAEDDGNCETPIFCQNDGCEKIAVAAKTHDYAEGYESDGEAHWHVCQNEGCTVTTEKIGHTPETDDGDCTTEIKCSVCGRIVTAKNEKHTDANNDTRCDNEGCNGVVEIVLALGDNTVGVPAGVSTVVTAVAGEDGTYRFTVTGEGAVVVISAGEYVLATIYGTVTEENKNVFEIAATAGQTLTITVSVVDAEADTSCTINVDYVNDNIEGDDDAIGNMLIVPIN